MKKPLFIILPIIILLSSCRTYLDAERNSISTDYMRFNYYKKYNELDYFNKVNASADRQVYYTTHFTIGLPKNIVYWKQSGNKFYCEYDAKQIIYVYTGYKNVGAELGKWELKNLEVGKEIDYLDEYWIKERKYKESLLSKRDNKRITKLYTNGKYEILLYNIKEDKFPLFLDFAKTFKSR